MSRVLLVTNDFPPRRGGIQRYLYELTRRLPAERVAVYAPAWPDAHRFDAGLDFPVLRHPASLMLPSPDVLRAAATFAREQRCDRVWFGASAPLGALAGGMRTRGLSRVVASTHGHEVGWAMLPGARTALREIGRRCDVLTVVSRYTRRRVAAAFGPMAALEQLPPAVDADEFRPDAGAREQLRRRYRVGSAPVVLCVSRLVPRKGQDALIRALPAVRDAVAGTRVLLVGAGRDETRLRRLAEHCGVAGAVLFTGAVGGDELPAHYAMADVFALPCRSRAGGLDTEGLGIVLLEAAATGLPVVAGAGGGAGQAVRPGETGEIVDGRDVGALAAALTALLADPGRAAALGAAGRHWMRREWSWAQRGRRLAELLWPDGPPPTPNYGAILR